nr:glycosyltransferase [Phyllobacterium sp. SYP-B3895]
MNIPSAIEYKDPWATSYEARLSQLVAQDRRIAYFYEQPDSSTFRYRALNPGLSLAGDPKGGTSSAWFDLRDLAVDSKFVDEADALVICRVRYSAPVARMIARARARNIPVFFDCDDLVFDPARVHLLVDSLNVEQQNDHTWDSWFAYVGRLGATLELCDGIITTNEYLAERAREYNQRLHTAIMPNYLHPEQQKWSLRFGEAKRASKRQRDERIHIGYFSGSPSHTRDFAVAMPAIRRLLASDPRIVLRIVGFGVFGAEFDQFRDRIEYYPLQDFLNLQRLIAEVEINISPLKENQFTNCKSELKFFEAAACGTLTLASPTYAFKKSIVHGVTGFLVPSFRWDDALEEAVAMVDDAAAYDAISTAASDYVVDTYGWDRQADKIENAVFGG